MIDVKAIELENNRTLIWVKLMKAVILTLTVVASITVFASVVRAQSNRAPNQQTEDFTLSGESLTNIESRSVEGDFSTFFPGDSSGRAAVSNGREEYNLSKKRGRGLLQVDDNVELLINRRSPQPINASPFAGQSERFNDTQKVEVQLGVE